MAVQRPCIDGFQLMCEGVRLSASTIAITARDGFSLVGTLYQPETPNHVTVLISSATTVARRYYDKFAQFLKAQGFVVATYDFRGIGESIDRRWRGRPASFRAWAEEDLAGAIDTLTRMFPNNDLMCVGHSMGGTLLGLAPNNQKVAAQLALSAQSSYWRNADDPASRRRLWLLTTILFPAVTPVVGYFPGRLIGSGNWPKGVALEWARWSRNPDFITDERGAPLREHFERYRGKLRFYVIKDDPYFAPPRAVAQLASFYRSAEVEIVTRSPEDYGVKAIGHFGFFRSTMPEVAWRETAEWLRDASPRARRMQASPG